jgi:hypothetical protein
MKVLLVYNPWNLRKPDHSPYDVKIKGSFESAFGETNEHTYETLHFGYEPELIRDNKTLNEEILKRDFDIAVVSEEMEFHMTLDTAKKLGKKLFIHVWDTWIALASSPEVNLKLAMKSPKIWGEHYNPSSINQLSEYCNVLIMDMGYGEIKPNVYAMMNAVDTRIYHPNPEIEQNIDVSHNGTIYVAERAKFGNIFHKAGINVNYSGSIPARTYRDKHLSEEDYVKVFQRAKINLCYTESIFGPNHKQRKGRIPEVASCAGFMLMTHADALKWKQNYWFKDGEHFISMNEYDCVDKVRYYLNNPEKRKAIGQALYNEWLDKYSPRKYWEKIFEYSKG